MRVDFSKDFKKEYKKLSKKLQAKIDERLLIFMGDKFHPLLDNHQLHGEWHGYRSVNITGNIRAIYEELGDLTYFVAIGTHPELYS